MSRHDCLARLAELATIPSLVLSARHDRIAPPSYGRRLAAAIPGAVFEEIADSSHGVTLHRPGLINERLARFLTSVDAAQA